MVGRQCLVSSLKLICERLCFHIDDGYSVDEGYSIVRSEHDISKLKSVVGRYQTFLMVNDKVITIDSMLPSPVSEMDYSQFLHSYGVLGYEEKLDGDCRLFLVKNDCSINVVVDNNIVEFVENNLLTVNHSKVVKDSISAVLSQKQSNILNDVDKKQIERCTVSNLRQTIRTGLAGGKYFFSFITNGTKIKFYVVIDVINLKGLKQLSEIFDYECDDAYGDILNFHMLFGNAIKVIDIRCDYRNTVNVSALTRNCRRFSNYFFDSAGDKTLYYGKVNGIPVTKRENMGVILEWKLYSDDEFLGFKVTKKNPLYSYRFFICVEEMNDFIRSEFVDIGECFINVTQAGVLDDVMVFSLINVKTMSFNDDCSYRIGLLHGLSVLVRWLLTFLRGVDNKSGYYGFDLDGIGRDKSFCYLIGHRYVVGVTSIKKFTFNLDTFEYIDTDILKEGEVLKSDNVNGYSCQRYVYLV
jgi:hypothetical protein